MAMKRDQEPKDTEYNHGRGLMPPLSLQPEPKGYEQLHALYRMDSVDPGAVPSYDGTGNRTDIPVVTPVRADGKLTEDKNNG